MQERESPKLEIGCGTAKGDDTFFVGQNAARQAMESINLHPLSAVLVFVSVKYDLAALLEGVRSVTGAVPLLGATTAG